MCHNLFNLILQVPFSLHYYALKIKHKNLGLLALRIAHVGRGSIFYSARALGEYSLLCPQEPATSLGAPPSLHCFSLKGAPQFCLTLLPFGGHSLHTAPLGLGEPASCSELTQPGSECPSETLHRALFQ